MIEKAEFRKRVEDFTLATTKARAVLVQLELLQPIGFLVKADGSLEKAPRWMTWSPEAVQCADKIEQEIEQCRQKYLGPMSWPTVSVL